MTYQKPTSDPPTGPTPEQINARLEALLKRTHELRRAQPTRRTGGHPDEVPTWPPSDRDLAAVEVVDVPASGVGGSMAATSAAGTAPLPQETSTDNVARQHPDWNSLRMRDAPPGALVTRTPRWVWPVLAMLVVALAAETAYLAWKAPWADAPVSAVTAEPPDPGMAPAAVPAAEPAPIAQAELAQPSTTTPAPAAPIEPAPTGTPDTAGATSATTGAVRIESDPPGAVVTMEGRERGVTPITIGRLRPGRHDVIVVRPGLGRVDLKVDIAAGQTTRLDASGRPPVPR